MTKKPPHLYLILIETHRRLKIAAAEVGVYISELVEDAIQDLLRDLEEVPPGVTGNKARAFLANFVGSDATVIGAIPEQDASTLSRTSHRYNSDIRNALKAST